MPFPVREPTTSELLSTSIPDQAGRLPDLLATQARRRPSAVAAVDDTTSLTFAELQHRAAALADHLVALGVRPDERVGVFLESSPASLVSVWGTLLSGACYVPLAPDYPDERVRYMIEDAGASVVLTETGLRERVADLVPAPTTVLAVDDLRAPPSSGRDATARNPASPHDLAYVIYTSGSTGTPKGVMVEHHNVLNQLRWLATAHGIGPGRVVLQKTPASFDAAQWELLAVGCGATVAFGPPGLHRDPAGLVEVLHRRRVTDLQCVPTLLRALLDTGGLAECASLARVFSGGEALPRDLALRFLDEVTGRRLVNLYGPTECTINTSDVVVDRDLLAGSSEVVTIGRPVDGVTYRILDAAGDPAPIGVTGELCIGGLQVARGYLGREDLTAERFVPLPDARGTGRMFRTGDLASWNDDGTVRFLGRADNQVKVRGYRIELDEVRHRVEGHQWVRQAGVVVAPDARTGLDQLAAFVELNPREAALMDQGHHGGHHQSKASRLQVRAQIAGRGSRDPDELEQYPAVELPDVDELQHRRQAFARKTYRFYEGDPIGVDDVRRTLRSASSPTVTPVGSPALDGLDLDALADVLRHLEPHRGPERLLPKYGYASPGALYATQLYLELRGVRGLPDGVYYHQASGHRLVRVRGVGVPSVGGPALALHFVGRRDAIEPVYRTNVREVLEIETGHMIGLLEQALAGRGVAVVPAVFDDRRVTGLGCADDDLYLGSFDLLDGRARRPWGTTDLYVQVHGEHVEGLAAGLHAVEGDRLTLLGADVVRRHEVIAINQEVYDRAGLGVTIVSTGECDELAYVGLGRTLQRLSMADAGLGFMPAGYSSRNGLDLPAARRMQRLLTAAGRRTGPTYFAVGGPISAEQRHHEGMKEDAVHMRGPAEMIRDDLARVLPDYMVPHRVHVLDELPTSVNGKIDLSALGVLAAEEVRADRPFQPPRTSVERALCLLWTRAMSLDSISVHADFFASGGNSLVAVALVGQISEAFGIALPLQILFEHSTVESLARHVESQRGARDRGAGRRASRLVPLRGGAGRPIFCWPGLGGYPMNLQLLSERLDLGRPVHAVQACGLNPGETPHATVPEMAAEDLALLRETHPTGPYTLWGYSFGARVAFEVAHRLEHDGERVDSLVLVAPGMPDVGGEPVVRSDPFTGTRYRTILFSAFAGTATGPLVERMLEEVHDEDTFVAFVATRFPALETGLIRRVARIVARTYRSRYDFEELAGRRVEAPITVVKARGDDYSFLEHARGYAAQAPTIVGLEADHYGLLREPGVDELVDVLHRATRTVAATTRRPPVPHVNIKHHPVTLTPDQQAALVRELTTVITRTFACPEDAVSIALESVDEGHWHEKVYGPEIVARRDLLAKSPNY